MLRGVALSILFVLYLGARVVIYDSSLRAFLITNVRNVSYVYIEYKTLAKDWISAFLTRDFQFLIIQPLAYSLMTASFNHFNTEGPPESFKTY